MTPNLVALLISVPLTKDGFARAWAQGSDYLHREYSDLKNGWQKYEKQARLAFTLASECAVLGTHLVLEASLSDLTRATSNFPVVILLTHMSFPEVSKEDIRDPDAMLQRVQTGSEPEWDLVRQELPIRYGLGELIAVLNSVLRADLRQLASLPTKSIGDTRPYAVKRAEKNGLLRFDRPRLDELCGETVLAPGRGIELSGSMVTLAQVLSTIPNDYRGFIDVRACNSLSACAAIRRARPHLRLAASKRRVLPEASLILVKLAIQYMAGQHRIGKPVSYEAAMKQVIEVLQ